MHPSPILWPTIQEYSVHVRVEYGFLMLIHSYQVKYVHQNHSYVLQFPGYKLTKLE